MACPSCDEADGQERLGRLGDRPHVVYHCENCGRIYLVLEDEGDGAEAAD